MQPSSWRSTLVPPSSPTSTSPSSPRRHSFANSPLANPSPTTSRFFDFATLRASPRKERTESFEAREERLEREHEREQEELVEDAPPSPNVNVVPFRLAAVPVRPGPSRLRSSSYSTPKPQSIVPNFSLPNFSHRSTDNSPSAGSQWATRRSGMFDQEEQPESPTPDSPMDRMLDNQPARPVPPKPTSPLPPLPYEALDPPRATSPQPSIPTFSPPLSALQEGRPLSVRQLSPIALAALADTPPRPSSSTSFPAAGSRPQVPPKSTSRPGVPGSGPSRDSGIFEADVFAHGTRSRSTSTGSVSKPSSLSGPASTPILGLAYPRPRIGMPARTPSLSQAGSASSRASSSVFTPGRSSGHSGDGTDWARTSESEMDRGKEEYLFFGGGAEGGEEGLRKPTGYRSVTTLRLDLVDDVPAPLGLGLGGLGIEGLGAGLGGGDSDLERGLEELARYARSLPSPIPPTGGPDGDEEGGGWRYRSDASPISPEEDEEDRTRYVRHLPVTEDAPVAHSRSVSRNGSVRLPPLPTHSQAASSWAGPSSLHKSRSMRSKRNASSTTAADMSESDAYVSVDESGVEDLTTDDEGGGGGGGADFSHARNFSYPDVGGQVGSVVVERRAEEWGEGMEEEVLRTKAPTRRGLFDGSDRSLEGAEVDANTTHLILARSTTPFLVSSLLRRTIPTLAFGLVVLDISNCQLIELPLSLASCPCLKELDIKGNLLASGTLPSFIGTLSSLRILIADNCGLSSLPQSLATLRHLHTLSVRFNHLHSLPGWLSRLNALDLLLVDGNDFHLQWANLVRPILLKPAKPAELSPEAGEAIYPPPFATYSARSSTSLSPLPESSAFASPTLSTARSSGGYSADFAGDILHHSASTASLRPGESAAYPFPTPASTSSSIFLPSPASASLHSFSTPPPATSPHLELADAQARHSKHQSDRPGTAGSFQSTSSGPALSPGSAGESNKKWKIFKKVSIKHIRPATLSQDGRASPIPATPEPPVVDPPKPTSAATNFRNRVLSRTSRALSLAEPERHVSRRTSFLKLEKVPTLDTMIGRASSPTSYSHDDIDQKGALRSVMAYLRDLDDLNTESEKVQSTGSPPLRTSPSLNNIRPGSGASPSPIRRAQSSRRLPGPGRTSSGGDPTVSRYDDDYVTSGRTTPVAGGPVAAPSPVKLRADLAKRKAVVAEIIETEKTYLRGLQELCGIYITAASVPVSSSSGKKDAVVPAIERRAVFGNVGAIRDFHETVFLPDLVAAAHPSVVMPGGEDSGAQRVARVFIQHAAFLKIYSSYVNAFDSALARVQSWTMVDAVRPRSSSGSTSSPAPSFARMASFNPTTPIVSTLSTNQKKRIKSYLKRCKANPRHSQISLESYLLLPVQRVPRYRMLLETLLSCTPADDSVDPALFEPHPVIEEALDLISDVATDMNERKRESEGRSQLLQWQNRIGNHFKSPLVQPHRSLLRSGTFTLVRTVKRSVTFVETNTRSAAMSPGSDLADVMQVHSLVTETTPQNLIALLLTDIIVFVKEPADPSDQNSPVGLYTVLRLGRTPPDKPPPVTLFGAGNMLRIVCDSRAILYLQCEKQSDASSWASAINVQMSLNN